MVRENQERTKGFEREIHFRLTRGKGRSSWQAWVQPKAGNEWEKLRPAETSFESAQAAIYEEMIAQVFPR